MRVSDEPSLVLTSEDYEDSVLQEIAKELREKLPITGNTASEVFHFPSTGDVRLKVLITYSQNSDCNESNTAHVDAFLFDDDEVDELVDEGKMSRNYCLDCGSWKTRPLSEYIAILCTDVQTLFRIP